MHMKSIKKEFGKDKEKNIFFQIGNKRKKKVKQDALTEISFLKKKK